MRLTLFLEAAMQVTTMDVGTNHALAREFRDDLNRAVRGRVRRTNVDDYRAFCLTLLESRTDRIRQSCLFFAHVDFLRYGTNGCSRCFG